MKKKTLLIAGATGIVGHAAIEHFGALPDWNVITLSRRAPALREGVRHLSADLADPTSCQTAISSTPDITHVLYAALYEKPQLMAGWTDPQQIETNRSMLRNLLDALASHAPGLRHVALLQGTKAYGSHVGPVPVPAKERWPRLPHPIFYWQQEDLLRDRQSHAEWCFTILRPQIVLGYAQASPMNVIAAIGAYAALRQEMGLPLSFPGGGRYVNACSDSRLIASAVEWAGRDPNAANQTFNIVNGDVLVWQDIWPSIAAHFGMQVGDDEPQALAREMPRYEHVWRRVVDRHGLRPTTLEGLIGSSWQFADRNLAHGQSHPDDRIVSPIKIRQAGFHGCVDTEDAILYWLGRMQDARWLPPGVRAA